MSVGGRVAFSDRKTPSQSPEWDARIEAAEQEQPRSEQEEREWRAGAKLNLAKRLLESKPQVGEEWLADIVKEYPDTDAAKEAQLLLSP